MNNHHPFSGSVSQPLPGVAGVILDDPGHAGFHAGAGDLALIAAQLDEITGHGWGSAMADAMATPGAIRARLTVDFAGGDRMTYTVKPDGRFCGLGTMAGPIAGAVLVLWGRLPELCGRNVAGAVESLRAGLGLPALAGWRVVGCGMDNPDVDWGRVAPPPPVWFVLSGELTVNPE